MSKKWHEPIPKDFPVQPLKADENPNGKTTCGHCQLSWDDDQHTTYTPVPSGRCPFEAFHKYPEAPKEQGEFTPTGDFYYVSDKAEKIITEDSYAEGLSGIEEEEELQAYVVKANTLSELVAGIAKAYRLPMTDLFVRSPYFKNDEITAICFSRLETRAGKPSTPAVKAKWEKGEAKLYEAEYVFGIKKRLSRGVTEADFEAAGVEIETDA